MVLLPLGHSYDFPRAIEVYPNDLDKIEQALTQQNTKCAPCAQLFWCAVCESFIIIEHTCQNEILVRKSSQHTPYLSILKLVYNIIR